MAPLRVCLLLFAFFVSARGFGFRGFTFKGLKEPELDPARGGSIRERWIEQPVDHFNVRDNRTWSMRYYENDRHFNASGPMLIMLGGEWEIEPGSLQDGLICDIGKDHGAMLYYTEHRYYGKSHPVEDTSTENLQYLSVDQAIADVAYFIETKKKKNPGLANSKVVVFGGSYAGNMAAWIRIKYPHLVQGAIASSAPVRAKADFFEYNEVVEKSLARYNKQCVEDIKQAFNTVEEWLTNRTDGAEKLKALFNLCDLPDVSSSTALAHILNSFGETFAGPVQYNHINNIDGTSNIAKTCDKMMNKSLGSPIERLKQLVNREDDEDGCLDVNYDKFIDDYTETSWESQKKSDFMRPWTYQTCTEYGYFSTTNSNHSIFGSLVSLDYYLQLCSDIYGEYYDSSLVNSKVRRTNIMYGGSLPDVQNVVFVNGNFDPWHALSVLEDLNEDSPSILINGASHCEDLQSDYEDDVPELQDAREELRDIVYDWLDSE